MGLISIRILLVNIVTILMVTVSAASYSKGTEFKYEVYGAYANTEDETGLFEYDRYNLGITLYGDSVGYGDYPFLLTNFFERRTALDFAYSYNESNSPDDEFTGDLYQVTYSFASVSSRLLFDVGARRLVAEGTDIWGDYDWDGTIYYFGIGLYVSPNAVAKFAITAADYVLSDESTGIDYDYDETHLEASWQHVFKTSPDHYLALLISVEAIEIGSSKNSNIGGILDYYFSRKAGVGFGYTAHRGDYDVTEGETVALRGSVFADEHLGFEATVERLMAEVSGNDEDSFYIKARYRF